MKYLKTFEFTTKHIPKLGEYVIMKPSITDVTDDEHQYMKHLKNFEYFDYYDNKISEDYIQDLSNKIENSNNIYDGKVGINGFDILPISNDDNKFTWANLNYQIHLYLYHEYDDIIFLDIECDYDILENIELNIKIPNSDKKVNDAYEKIIKTLKNITKDLNKRDRIIDEISKIDNLFNPIEIKISINNKKFKSIQIEDDKINGIPFNKIETSDIFKIYNKIKRYKPEIFSAYKFNL